MIQGFTTKKVHSYTLGEQLKKIRSESRLNLAEVSRETKIPVKYLTMIEEGHYDKLPPEVYVKGFLKSYADFLGVDAKKLINLYMREKDINVNMGTQNCATQSPVKFVKLPRFVLTPKMMTLFLALAIGVGGFFYLYREIGRFASLPRLVVTDPAGDTSIGENSITITGFTDQDAKLTINDQPVIVNDNGEFHEKISLQDGLNKISISSVNRFGKVASRLLNVKTAYSKPDMALNSDSGGAGGIVSGDETQKNGGVEVTVRVDANPTWLSIESDGGLVYSGTMLSGTTQNFQGEKEVRITSGKANQTFIKVNGKNEKMLANNPGIVRDVTFGPSD